MMAGAIAGNISPEATKPFGNIFADATRGLWRHWRKSRSVTMQFMM